MLERMSDFFESRLAGYDAHMLANIDSARIFYPYTAGLLPTAPDCRVLDLGCGTGLELEYYPYSEAKPWELTPLPIRLALRSRW